MERPSMKYRLMDLLACPICKEFPLELKVFAEREVDRAPALVKCELYCGYERKQVSELEEKPCEACGKREISEGVLLCQECARWYPIIEDIPRMLPDDLRNKNQDLPFMSKWRSEIPQNVLDSGKPFNLKQR